MSKINDFITAFTKEEISFIKVKKNYFYNYAPVTETVKKIKLPVFSFSLPFGTLKDNHFNPSLALLEILAKKSDRKLLVDSERLEWLFLCGRDLFKENIESYSNGLFLVRNNNEENLGLCFVNRRKREIKNIIDRGDFLRRES